MTMNKLSSLFLAYLLTIAVFLPTAAQFTHEFTCEHEHKHSEENHLEETTYSCDYLLFHFSHAETINFAEIVFATQIIDLNDGFINIAPTSDTYRYAFNLRAPPSLS